ncbi:hypothetical protein SAY87_013338 [Trapa incisa]|uniref:Uncharacterized protein n=1 Tax=Trapa incisa TaxID=236973 RepID=A0AAN7KJA8_9MYRT|nr:hypothetical protein SAY87_013338 [Trapa incisa]
MGSNRMYSHQYSVSDFGVELSQAPQWTPPAIQEFRVHHNSNSASLSLPFATPLKESGNPERLGSTSSRSGSSESELGSRLHFHTQPSNSSRCLFVSKPVYPLSLPIRSPARVASDIDQRSSSTSSSVDFSFSQASESLESEPRRLHNLSIDHRCRLCDRFLSQISMGLPSHCEER